MGTTAELQLFFVDKQIWKALLILGPEGIDTHNCLSKNKQLISLLNQKYGHYKTLQVEKDPAIDELLYVSACTPIGLGLYTAKYHWLTSLFLINSSLFGEDGEHYIEIEYIYRTRSKSGKKFDKNKILKKL